MTVKLARRRRMPTGRNKEKMDRGRVEFQADRDFVERLDRESKLGGHGSVSALIRVVMTEYMNRKDKERKESNQ